VHNPRISYRYPYSQQAKKCGNVGCLRHISYFTVNLIVGSVYESFSNLLSIIYCWCLCACVASVTLLVGVFDGACSKLYCSLDEF
jgi:multidrug efflux pump subunit AcrB